MAKSVEMIIQAQEAERGRLARKMHDGPAQALSNFILQTEIAMRLFDIDQSKAKEELAGVKTAASSTFQKVRDFIFDLRPMMLDDLGLVPTITRYVDTFKEQSGIEVRLISTGMEQRFESYLEVMVFRAIQELLGNIAAPQPGYPGDPSNGFIDNRLTRSVLKIMVKGLMSKKYRNQVEWG